MAAGEQKIWREQNTEAFSALTATAFRPAVAARCAGRPLQRPTNRALWGLKMHGFTLAIENAVGKHEAVVGPNALRSNSPPRIPPERFFGNRQRHKQTAEAG